MVVSTFVFVVVAIFLVRAALAPSLDETERLRHCEERLAFVSGAALDHYGWLYGTPRHHTEDDDSYRKRLAVARARSFAV